MIQSKRLAQIVRYGPFSSSATASILILLSGGRKGPQIFCTIFVICDGLVSLLYHRAHCACFKFPLFEPLCTNNGKCSHHLTEHLEHWEISVSDFSVNFCDVPFTSKTVSQNRFTLRYQIAHSKPITFKMV